MLLFLWLGLLPSQRGFQSSVLLSAVEELPGGKPLARSGDGMEPAGPAAKGRPKKDKPWHLNYRGDLGSLDLLRLLGGEPAGTSAAGGRPGALRQR